MKGPTGYTPNLNLRATPSQVNMLVRLGVDKGVAVKLGRVDASNEINRLKPAGARI